MDKNMTVLEFCEKYNNITSEKIKIEMIKGIIKRTYCPIQEKRLVLKAMLDSSIIEEAHGKYIDLVSSRISYTISLIILYTTLKPDTSEDGNEAKIHEIYDELIKTDIVERICEQLGEKEVSEFSTINELIIQNFYNAYTSPYAVVGHFANKIGQRIGIGIGYALEQLDILMADEKGFEKLIDKIKSKIS